MPRCVAMTWVGSQARWTKMYQGVRYYVSTNELGTEPTQAASVNAANEWWRKKRAEIDGAKPPSKPVPGSPEAQHRILEAWAGQPLTPQDLPEAMAGFANDYADNPPPKGVLEAFLGPQRMATIKTAVNKLIDGQVNHEKTVGKWVDLWVNNERQRIKTGKVGNSRVDMNRICLCHFRDWIGATTEVSSINGGKWLEWFQHLAAQVDKKRWNESHVDRILGVSKRFIRFLWEMEQIDLPRNLDKKDIAFSISPSKIETFTDEELSKLWAVVANQSRLHFLLMLNCGMVGKDINDLRQDEVDWTQGIITRKRSKTNKNENVPVVRYKLWEETFTLLQKWRSQDPEIVLLTQTGQRWILPHQGEVSWSRSDSVASTMRHWLRKAGVKHAPKALRATGATKLADHKDYKFYAQYYLGQSPRGVANTNYVVPSDKEFFKALAWLRTALGIA